MRMKRKNISAKKLALRVLCTKNLPFELCEPKNSPFELCEPKNSSFELCEPIWGGRGECRICIIRGFIFCCSNNTYPTLVTSCLGNICHACLFVALIFVSSVLCWKPEYLERISVLVLEVLCFLPVLWHAHVFEIFAGFLSLGVPVETGCRVLGFGLRYVLNHTQAPKDTWKFMRTHQNMNKTLHKTSLVWKFVKNESLSSRQSCETGSFNVVLFWIMDECFRQKKWNVKEVAWCIVETIDA